jgi:hypothetical protein
MTEKQITSRMHMTAESVEKLFLRLPVEINKNIPAEYYVHGPFSPNHLP